MDILYALQSYSNTNNIIYKLFIKFLAGASVKTGIKY